jgi:hypothetical protein
MSDKAKYLNIGAVVEFEGKEKLQLDNGSLAELVGFLKEHGKKYLTDKSLEEIRAGQKCKKDDPNYIPRINLYYFEPNEKAPSFVRWNVAVKVR